MACDAREGIDCLRDHVWPYLDDPKPNAAGDGYRALAPCHHDTERSLSISVGGSGRVIWHCFAGCTSEQTRDALIRRRIHGWCLQRPAGDVAAADAAVEALVFGKLSHAHARLFLAARLRGYGDDLPRGAELATLAEDCGVSLREAYKARGVLHR